MKNLCCPVPLHAALKRAVWGGGRLTATGIAAEKEMPPAGVEPIAEAWCLSVRDSDGECCTLADGRLLKCVLPENIGHFPYLVKLIDAATPLSVQVHPDDDYAHDQGLPNGKTEIWYIVDARPDAFIYAGLNEGETAESFALALQEGRVEEVLHRQPVEAGESYFIPAGMPHAIGGGVLIAEIQQNSDTTYRVYDYNRRDSQGRLRELHTKHAMAVIRPFTAEEITAAQYAAVQSIPDADMLAVTADFTLRQISGEGTLASPCTVMALEDCTLTYADGALALAPLRTCYVPDGVCCHMTGKALVVTA